MIELEIDPLQWRTDIEGGRSLYFNGATCAHFTHTKILMQTWFSIHQDPKGGLEIRSHSEGKLPITLLMRLAPVYYKTPSIFAHDYETFSEAVDALEDEVIPYIKDFAKSLMEQVASF